MKFNLINLIYKICTRLYNSDYITFACNFDTDKYLNLSVLHEELVSRHVKIKSKFIYDHKNIVDRLRQIIVIASSRIIIVDCSHWIISNIDVNKYTKVVYIGHGGGAYKKMGFERKILTANSTRKYGQFSYALSTSNFCDKCIKKNFNIDEASLIKCGLPRTDLIKSFNIEEESRKTILLTPSYYEKSNKRLIAWDLNDLVEKLSKLGFELIISLHPDIHDENICTNERLKMMSMKENYIENISKADILITDVSSLMFDFSVTKKPIIIFDTVSYVSTWIKPNDLPGVNIVNSMGELISKLQNMNKLKGSKDLFEFQMNRCNGKSCKVVIDKVLEIYYE